MLSLLLRQAVVIALSAVTIAARRARGMFLPVATGAGDRRAFHRRRQRRRDGAQSRGGDRDAARQPFVVVIGTRRNRHDRLRTTSERAGRQLYSSAQVPTPISIAPHLIKGGSSVPFVEYICQSFENVFTVAIPSESPSVRSRT